MRTEDDRDTRDELLQRARTAGEYTDAFSGGYCPMMLRYGFLVPDQDYIDAENTRRERRRNGN